MKRFALALSLFLLASGLCRAQSSPAGKVRVGLKFGFSCGRLTGVDSELERHGGLAAGLVATIRLSERWSLSPEVTPGLPKGASNIPFVTTGDPGLDSVFAGSADSALLLSYLDIPVLLKYRMGRFGLGGGPYLGFLMSATERFEAELETGKTAVYKEDVAGRYSGVDCGLALEASVVATRRRGGGDGLVFHVRCQLGLADIVKDPAASGAVRTMGLQVFASFPLVF